MILKYHKDLTLNKWLTFPLYKRILMIATEFIRSKSSIEKGNAEEVKECYERALELLDLTIETARGSLLRELLRLREVIASCYIKGIITINDNRSIYVTLISLNKDAFNSVTK